MKKSQNKRELILESIIETYLLANTPIGSNELNSSLCIPASTIRVYLKRLSDEGLITQLHISSGRIPAVKTMQSYWQNELDTNEELQIKNINFLRTLSEEFEIYCLIYEGRELMLKEILNLNDKFIILDFGANEMALKYQNEAFEFLKSLIGLNIFDIENIALKVHFYELVEKISTIKKSLTCYRANEKKACQIYQNDDFVKLLDCEIHKYFKENLQFQPLFKEGFMGLKIDTNFLGKQANLIVAGSVYTNYKKILKQIKEVA
ncbi:HrcA family transcriptional regulator [Campylobacter helveticus]|uniref:HrcA family transcriptional regulator n=1 Tax=Campylobacter helveticus TaxID=28898 RepID=UPI00214A6CE5|nr:HrcA family transcriptional regulator [Campylobacter helveticus]MCR2056089.1 HrcA family transcriptional regulator [Campylobacter helveticus]